MLTRQLRPWFFYLLDYIASAEISKCGDQKKKTPLMYLSTPAEFFITFLTTFQKKYEICLQDNLGFFLFVGLGFFLFVGLHVTGWVYLVYFSILPVHSLMFVMSIYCYFFIL